MKDLQRNLQGGLTVDFIEGHISTVTDEKF